MARVTRATNISDVNVTSLASRNPMRYVDALVERTAMMPPNPHRQRFPTRPQSANTTWRALQGVFFQGVTDLSFRGNKSGEVVELTDDMETQHWEL